MLNVEQFLHGLYPEALSRLASRQYSFKRDAKAWVFSGESPGRYLNSAYASDWLELLNLTIKYADFFKQPFDLIRQDDADFSVQPEFLDLSLSPVSMSVMYKKLNQFLDETDAYYVLQVQDSDTFVDMCNLQGEIYTPEPKIEVFRGEEQKFIRDPRVFGLIAGNDTDLVATGTFVFYGYGNQQASCWNLGTVAGFGGQGAGSAVLRSGMNKLYAQGVEELYVPTERAGEEFYESHGFEKIGSFARSRVKPGLHS